MLIRRQIIGCRLRFLLLRQLKLVENTDLLALNGPEHAARNTGDWLQIMIL